MAKVSQVSHGEGNTKPPRVRSRKWCFTLNNYTEDEYVKMSQEFKHDKFIIGKEIGEKGTKHLQGYIEFKNQKDLTNLKKINNRIHWEKAKGNQKQNIEYCSKEKNFIQNFYIDIKEEILKDEYENVVWKKWQEEILELIKAKPDKRKINWYWEETGNVGKSYLCKYIALTNNVIIADGKKENIFNQIKTAMDNNKEIVIIILDVPRTNLDFISYGAIEQIKNGLIYSGKYEGGICIFKIPHVIIFANEEPDKNKLSEDRWNIVDITARPGSPSS